MKLITEGMTAHEAIGWLDTMKRRNEPQVIEAVEAFRKEMRDNVVPRIEEAIRERRRAAQRARAVILDR